MGGKRSWLWSALLLCPGSAAQAQTTGDRARAALVATGASTVFGFLVGLASPKYVWEVPLAAPAAGAVSPERGLGR